MSCEGGGEGESERVQEVSNKASRRGGLDGVEDERVDCAGIQACHGVFCLLCHLSLVLVCWWALRPVTKLLY